jgi:FkbM family methyltransferase
MVSYAQNLEDVILRRALHDIKGGFYIDIGAWDPVHDSVTNWFYQDGWRGINIEPNPQFAARLTEERPGDTILTCAVSDSEGYADFTVVEGTGLSSLSVTEAADIATRNSVRNTIVVKTRTLSQVWDEHVGDRSVDFLKIDAEGAEDRILAGADFKAHRPRIIVVEATVPLTRESSWSTFEPPLLAADYALAYFDGLNRFYVRREDEHRIETFALPPNVFDNYLHWSNIALQNRIDELTAAFHLQSDLIAHQREHIRLIQAGIAVSDLDLEPVLQIVGGSTHDAGDLAADSSTGGGQP